MQLKFSKNTYLLIIFIFSIVCFYVRNIKKKNNDSKNTLFLIKNDLSQIKSKNIKFIEKLYNDQFTKSNSINYILIHSDTDCNGCILLGEKFINTLEFPYELELVILKDQLLLENISQYKCKVIDKKYTIKSKFLFDVKTPAILKFDSSYTVLDAFFPGVQNNEDFKTFIEN